MWNSHQIYNNMNNGQPYDTINICITYLDNAGYSTCCYMDMGCKFRFLG